MTNINKIKNDLWEAANKLRADSSLKTNEFATPVLGLIFLRYADFKFSEAKKNLDNELLKLSQRLRSCFNEPNWFHAKGILYLEEKSRFSYLLNLSESEDLGKKLEDAMSLIEQENKLKEFAKKKMVEEMKSEMKKIHDECLLQIKK